MITQQQHVQSSKRALLRELSLEQQQEFLDSLSENELVSLASDWDYWGRPDQQIPEELLSGDKTIWLPLAGRGWGKTRTGAEFVRTLINRGYGRIALIGPTAADTRDVMVEGESGLLNIFPDHERPIYESSKRLVTFSNGAQAHLYSAEEPERLRGPQHDAGWCDEICAWKNQQDTWDMYEFGARLGAHPLTIVTTTPKPTKFLKELIADHETHVTKGRTLDNAVNLSDKFIARIKRKYEGTRLGRQELNAEILDDNPNALFTRKHIEDGRVQKAPELVRIVVAIDPAVTNTEGSDATGIVACGIDANNRGYVLDDSTLKDDVSVWAQVAVGVFDDMEADLIVGEANNGGDLIENVIRQAEKAATRVKKSPIAYNKVTATRGKAIRAEFLTLLYEQGKIHHVGTYPDLEDEMCDFDPTLVNQDSPNRLDALVWAFTELFNKKTREVRVMVI